jgi:hypothetical protein
MKKRNHSKRGRPRERLLKLPVLTNLKNAAALFGCEPELLLDARDAGCPGFRHNRMDVAAILPWLICWLAEGKRAPTEFPATTEISPRQEIDIWTAKLKQAQYEERIGLLVRKEEVAEGVRIAVPAFYEAAERLFTNELPPKLVGLRELEIRDKCREAVEQCKTTIREGLEKLVRDGEAELAKSQTKEEET